MINTNNQNNDTNSNLVNKLGDSNLMKQGVHEVTKTESGELQQATQFIEAESNEPITEATEQLFTDYARGVEETSTSIGVNRNRLILKRKLEKAERRTNENIWQDAINLVRYHSNSLAERVADEVQGIKKYASPTEEDNKPPIWVTNPVNIYKLGEVQEGSLGGNETSSTVDSNKVNKGQSFDI